MDLSKGKIMKLRGAVAGIAAVLLAFLPSAARAADTPEVVYQKLHGSVRTSNLQEVLKYITEQRRKEMAAAPKHQIALLAEKVPEAYTITGKQFSPDGNKAQLRATGMHSFKGQKKAPMYGIADLVKQRGEWKVDEWGWTGAVAAKVALARPSGNNAIMGSARPIKRFTNWLPSGYLSPLTRTDCCW